MKLPALRSRRPADGETPRRPTAPWQRLRVPRPTDLRGIIQRNPGLKLISLLLAALLWYSITKTERDAERVIEVPISLRKIPESMTVMNPPTKAVSVTLRGPRTILDNLDERLKLVLDRLAAIDVRSLNETLAGTREAAQSLNEVLEELKRYPSGFLLGGAPPPATGLEKEKK